MNQTAERLTPGEHGRYPDLAGRSLPSALVLLFIPTLAAMLTRSEELKGQPLTEDEVRRIRDNCPVVVSGAVPAAAVEAGGAYADLDPAGPWPGWQALRASGSGRRGLRSRR